MPYNTRREFPTHDDENSDAKRGPSQSNAVRWPDAPEPVYAGDGTVRNAVEQCGTCGEPSTIGYRCSECGTDLIGAGT